MDYELLINYDPRKTVEGNSELFQSFELWKSFLKMKNLPF
jgi:hypothetical protein